MKIIADENIPCVEQAFASLGEVSLLPGRGMRPEHVADADILLVRSVTRVDESLLAGSSVKFVGSATIGFDHVDRGYLSRQGTGFATAPGSNATSAAEYVVSALLVLAEQQGFELSDMRVGIIGFGNVGSRVYSKLSALGMTCLVNDPPLQAQGGPGDFTNLDAVLQTDIVTVHVPYTRTGQWPTHHLVDRQLLGKLGTSTLLINTSRGAVADNDALDQWLDTHPDVSVVLDVWEGEPAINLKLMNKVALATPHIAGYSLDGKLRGTDMIYQAACDYFSRPVSWRAADVLPDRPTIELDEVSQADRVRAAVLSCYDVRADDARLRKIAGQAVSDRSVFFDRLRKEYPVRREFSEVNVVCNTASTELQHTLSGLGFDLSKPVVSG